MISERSEATVSGWTAEVVAGSAAAEVVAVGSTGVCEGRSTGACGAGAGLEPQLHGIHELDWVAVVESAAEATSAAGCGGVAASGWGVVEAAGVSVAGGSGFLDEPPEPQRERARLLEGIWPAATEPATAPPLSRVSDDAPLAER